MEERRQRLEHQGEGHEHREHQERRDDEACRHNEERRSRPGARARLLHPKGARGLLRTVGEGGLLRAKGRHLPFALDVRLPLNRPRIPALPNEAPPTSWRVVGALSISETIAWGTLYYSFGVLLRPFASHLAVSEAAIAGAFSVALLGAAAAAWVAGTSIDRWGPRPVMVAGALLGVASLLWLGVTDTVVGFYVAWAAIGVSHAGVLYEPAFAAITKWFLAPSERARALLTVTTVAGFASTLFVPLTASLYEHVGRSRTVFVLAAFVGLVVLPLNVTLPKHVPSMTRSSALPATAGESVREGASSPRVALLATVFSLHAFASAGVTVHLVSHLREGGRDVVAAATIAGLVGAAQVPARLLFRAFQRFVAARARLPILFGMQALALAALVVPSPTAVLLGALLFGAANGLLTLERAIVIADSFGAEQYGAASGRIATFAHATRAAGPVAVGLVRAASSYTLALLGLAALSALAGVIFWSHGGARRG